MAAEIKELQSKLDTVKKMNKKMMEENEALKEEYEKLQTDIADESKQALIHHHHPLNHQEKKQKRWQ